MKTPPELARCFGKYVVLWSPSAITSTAFTFSFAFRPLTFICTLLPDFTFEGVVVIVSPAASATGTIANAHASAARARNFFEMPMRVLLDVSPTYQRLLVAATAFFLVT